MPGPHKTHQPPSEVAPDTFVVHDHTGEGVAPVLAAVNSLVIRGAEPVVVDTGFAANRERFLADVFGLVEPENLRWVVLSHDDVDHVGNVGALLEAAPHATLVASRDMGERLGPTLEVPEARVRWAEDGDVLDVGDRGLALVRPPLFDSPTTRGVFDPTTGVYWAADAFGAPMSHLVTHADRLDRRFWVEGMAAYHRRLVPWHDLLDVAAYQRAVDRVEALGIRAIASGHGPTIPERLVGAAFDGIRRFAAASGEPPAA